MWAYQGYQDGLGHRREFPESHSGDDENDDDNDNNDDDYLSVSLPKSDLLVANDS